MADGNENALEAGRDDPDQARVTSAIPSRPHHNKSMLQVSAEVGCLVRIRCPSKLPVRNLADLPF